MLKRGSKGLNRVAKTEHQRALNVTETAVNAMIRARDEGKPCVTCGMARTLEAGHFRPSTYDSTRFHPYDIHGQCALCNRFAGVMTFEHGRAVDRMHGRGTATFLERLSRQSGTLRDRNWEISELDMLRDAVRRDGGCTSRSTSS